MGLNYAGEPHFLSPRDDPWAGFCTGFVTMSVTGAGDLKSLRAGDFENGPWSIVYEIAAGDPNPDFEKRLVFRPT